MGRDKALIEIDGAPMLDRALAVLRTLFPEVYVSGRDWPGAPSIHDETPGLGPLGGVLAALANLSRPVFVLPCDAPAIRPETLRVLLDRRKAAYDPEALAWLFVHEPGDCPKTGRDGTSPFVESLVGVYEPSAEPFLRAALARGVRSLYAALPDAGRRSATIPAEALPEFHNINRPEDLTALLGRSPA